MSDFVINVSDQAFEDAVLKSDLPVLVDFWAPWCAPCRTIAPIVDEIAQEYEGRLRVVKVNTEDNPNTPVKYGVRGIPTLILFKQGRIEGTKVGALSKSQLAAFIDSNI